MTHPLWNNLFRRPPTLRDELTQAWRATPLFQDIPAREVQRLVATSHLRDYQPGEHVFSAGDRGAGAVMIYHGEVSIRRSDTELAVLGDGDFFGEVALVVDEPRTADAVATKPTQLVFLLRADVEEWIDRTPALGTRFALNLAGVMAGRLRLANELLAERA